MSKRTIVILSIGAIILFIGAVVATSAAAANCVATTTTTATCGAGAAGGFGIATLLLLVGGLLALVAWIFGLVKSAQASAWGWFVLVLLISPLGSLIYGLAGPEKNA